MFAHAACALVLLYVRSVASAQVRARATAGGCRCAPVRLLNYTMLRARTVRACASVYLWSCTRLEWSRYALVRVRKCQHILQGCSCALACVPVFCRVALAQVHNAGMRLGMQCSGCALAQVLERIRALARSCTIVGKHTCIRAPMHKRTAHPCLARNHFRFQFARARVHSCASAHAHTCLTAQHGIRAAAQTCIRACVHTCAIAHVRNCACARVHARTCA